MNDDVHYLVNRQLKIENFSIFTIDQNKRAITSYDSKRYYTSQFFSLPFHHPDIKKYEELKRKGEDVSMFEDTSPPHFIPSYFWTKFTKNVEERKYIDAQGPLFNDHDNSAQNEIVLYSILQTSFESSSKDVSQSQYVGEKISKNSTASTDAEEIIEDGIIFDSHQLEHERQIIEDRSDQINFPSPMFFSENGQWKEIKEGEQELREITQHEHQEEEEEEEEEEGEEEEKGDEIQPGCSFWPENRNRLERVIEKYNKHSPIHDFVPTYLKRKRNSSDENEDEEEGEVDDDDEDEDENEDEEGDRVDNRFPSKLSKKKKRLREIERAFGFTVSDDVDVDDQDDFVV